MRGILWTAPLFALVAGCGSGTVAEKEDGEITQTETATETAPVPALAPTITKANADPEHSAENPASDILNTASMSGTWEVVGVTLMGGGVSVFSKNDPLILKSQMKVDDSALSWHALASDEFTADDTCNSPTITTSVGDTAPGDIQEQLSAAASRLGQKTSATMVHKWSCADDGNWGPETDDGGSHFLILENGEMVASWYDGVALLLKRSDGS